jgi:endonuclease/exonuclease/phosphatase family metal-dependent hydrolase
MAPRTTLIKRPFLMELRALKHLVNPAWLILGDFNLIYLDQDKNNGHLNRRTMPRFLRTLNHLEVYEIPLIGKQYLWSNEQNNPILTRIDRAFCTLQWEEIHLDPVLQAQSSLTSDHCPLLLTMQDQILGPSSFRFEAH